MKIVFLLLSLLCLGSFSKIDKTSLDIDWVDNLKGDFSFASKYSIKCEAWCYEWAGTKSIVAIQKSQDTVHCYTLCNAATHCSLSLDIVNNSCTPKIFLKSIVRNGDKTFEFKSGYIKIDKKLWNQKVLKAEFDINFKNDDADRPIFWKGKIYKKII